MVGMIICSVNIKSVIICSFGLEINIYLWPLHKYTVQTNNNLLKLNKFIVNK